MSFWSKLASSILVLLIGATSSLILILNQGDRLTQAVERYPAASTAISLSGVSEDDSVSVLAAFDRFVGTDGRAIIRVDPRANNVEGGLAGLRIGVLADARRPPDVLDLRFLDTTLVDAPTIGTLLRGEPSKSIGLDANAADVIAGIPELTFAPRLSVVQLAHLVDVSGTINGTYRVVGADPAQVRELLASLTAVTGQSAQTMLSPQHGQTTDDGLLPYILAGCLIAASILLLLVLVFEAVRALPVLGVHLLLGKARVGFVAGMFASVLLTAGVTMVLSMVCTVVLANGYQLNAALFMAAWSGSVVGAVPVLVAIVVAAAVLMSTRPVSAILGRYSKRLLLSVVAAASVVAVGAFSFLLVYIDGPMREVSKLANVRQTWASVEHQQVLYHMQVGNDDASFTYQSSQLDEDFYHWYRSIAEKPGVTLVNTAYFDRETVDGWVDAYKSPPTQPFWYMAASPSALASQGFAVSDDVIARAKRGERVFLLPATLTGPAKRAMQGWLTENSDTAEDPSIRTKYYDVEKIGFEEYAPKTPLFSWTTDPTLPTRITDPVILVTTSENMVAVESESLKAAGALENSYVKLGAAAAQKYTSTSYLARYHLDDNKVQFVSVSEYIAGLTKSIQATLQLFGGVILFASILVVVTLIALLRLFSTTYREQLAVKRMLGYSLLRLFVVPILVVGATGLAAVVAAAAMQSKSALFGNIILLAIEMALVTVLVRRYSRLQLSDALKE